MIVLVTQSTLTLTSLVSCRFQGFPPLNFQKLLWEVKSAQMISVLFMQGDVFTLAGLHCARTPGWDATGTLVLGLHGQKFIPIAQLQPCLL